MKKLIALFAALALSVGVGAQTLPSPTYQKITVAGSGSTGDVSGMSVTATGGSAARTLAAKSADIINVMDYGAKGDGSTDDGASINSAMSAARVMSAAGKSARVVFPPKQFKTSISLNFTGFRYVEIDGYGASIECYATGKSCIDMSNSQHIVVRGLTIYGRQSVSMDATTIPNVGLFMARGGSIGCGYSSMRDINIRGAFLFSSMYQSQCEVDHYTDFYIENRSTLSNTWVVVLDGSNHWNASSMSDYTASGFPAQNHYQGMDEVTFTHPFWVQYSANAHTAWVSGVHSFHVTDAGYSLAPNTTLPPVVLWDDNGKGVPGNVAHEWGMHFETNPTSIFTFDGASSITLPAFRYYERGNQATSSVFSLGSATSVSMPDLVLSIPIFYYSATVFDTPSAYSATGKIAVPTTNWVSPSNFSGCVTLGTDSMGCPATLPNLAGGLVYSASTNTLSFSAPNPISISAIAPSGSVGSITPTNGNAAWIIGLNGYTGGASPPVTVSAPPSSGTQASAHVSAMSIIGINFPLNTPGSGYSVNDIVTAVGGTCASPVKMKITAVSTGGVPTATSYNALGACTVPPTEPVTFTGGTGSGYTARQLVWTIAAIAVDSPGSGYMAATVSMAGNASGGTPTFAVTLTNTVTIDGGGAGHVSLDSTGTVLGAYGKPVVLSGVVRDGTAVRQSLGSAYTVPANTSMIRFIQSSTVASSTVTLPTALGDGQPLQFVNYAGSITALTFSPSVNGWTNGSTLAAYTGLRIRWDATSAAWYREQ